MKATNKNVVLYFVLAFAISWILWIPSLLNSSGYNMPGILLLFSQFAIMGPMIAAIIVLKASKEKGAVKQLFKGAWNWKFKKAWLIPTLLLPATIILITMWIKLSIEGGAFETAKLPAPIPIFAIILLVTGGPIEEFGWRGYALPKLLEKHSFLTASLILGLLHGLWHIPLHFMDGTVQSAMPLYEFVAVTAVGAVVYTWIFVNTNGNLMLMIAHHWAANFSAALLVYWDNTLGRWIFFIVQLVFVAGIVICRYLSKKKIDKAQKV